MNRISFVSFNKEKNPIDDVLQLFKRSHPYWYVYNIESIYHQYHWPDIILSEKEKVIKLNLSSIFPDELEDLIKRELISNNEYSNQEDLFSELKEQFIGVLGEYNHNGTIKLFIKRIEKTAQNYFSLMGGDIKDIIECLTEIVLIHEIVHWLMHKSMQPSVRKFKIRYTSQDEVYYHEGMAQYFTNEIINSSKMHTNIFNWLLASQIKRYRVFLDILPPKYSFKDVMAGLVTSSILDIQNWTKLTKEISDSSKISGSIEEKVEHSLLNRSF